MKFEPLIQPDLSDASLIERAGKLILTEGVHKLEQGKQAYIGPLASCFGLVIPIENGGAILAHISPDRKTKPLTELETIISQIDHRKIKSAFLFFKDLKLDDPESANKFKKINQILQLDIDLMLSVLKALNIPNVNKLAYTNDLTTVKIDTEAKQITAGILDPTDLTPKQGTTPFVQNY